jgi:hypothetical protein
MVPVSVNVLPVTNVTTDSKRASQTAAGLNPPVSPPLLITVVTLQLAAFADTFMLGGEVSAGAACPLKCIV